METRKFYFVLLLAFTTTLFTACNDDSSTTPAKKTDDTPEEVEGDYVGTWTSSGSQFPTDEFRNRFESMELIFNDDNTYTWTYVKKDGSKTVYAGYITPTKTEDLHTSGSAIWWLNIYVETINGQSFPGGWDGIFTFENPTTLKLNVEPRVTNWPKWPNTDDGLGSGESGMASVYTFSKQ